MTLNILPPLSRSLPRLTRSTLSASRSLSRASVPTLAAATRSTGTNSYSSSRGNNAKPAANQTGVEEPKVVAAANSTQSEEPEVAAAPQVQSKAAPASISGGEEWGTSYQGLGTKPFDKKAAEILTAPINEEDIEMKPDGLIYLPEIKYRRILNKAFGPGGWGMAPRSETNVGQGIVSREWVLVCEGRFVATARGEQEFFKPSGIPTASEAAKSNALMRCCKDLGIASELWDPRFIRQFKKKQCVEVWCSDTAGKKKKLWRRKDDPPFEYPWKENGFA
ncbi:mitochondrial genome maintenance MGM101 [Violaceomyces palustris]|uniref:Mitochondrial genome maintenance MGM101 n=1 Tax=Violaceomyces palustris TaxID=1673888 RepID=A0ACD0NU95_9BASI|nr:mitochondrial genome maintenance MGM101 [Violaceomyces palustris]